MRITFYVTRMLLGLLVVVDAYEEDITRVFGYLRWIVFLFDLLDGRISGLIELQLDDESRLGHVATGNHHQVGITLACSVLTMDDILVFAHISPYSIPKIKVLSGTAKRPTTLPAIYFCKGS